MMRVLRRVALGARGSVRMREASTTGIQRAVRGAALRASAACVLDLKKNNKIEPLVMHVLTPVLAGA